MGPITITLANQKGGVGKTTTALAVTRILSEAGYKVLSIDLDPQRNLDQGLGSAISRLDAETPSLYHVLQREKSLSDIIQHGKFCDFAPASNLMYGWIPPVGITTSEYEQYKDDEQALLKLIHERYSPTYKAQQNYEYLHLIEHEISNLEQHYDFVVIDTNPTLSNLSLSGIVAADYILIPAFAEDSSKEAILELYDTLVSLNMNQMKQIQILGILLTKYAKNTRVARRLESYIGDIAEQIGTVLFETKIRRSISVAEAVEIQTDLLDYDPTGNASLDYRAFGKELFARLSELEGRDFG